MISKISVQSVSLTVIMTSECLEINKLDYDNHVLRDKHTRMNAQALNCNSYI